MRSYETLKENISKGWQSWDNASVLSHIWMPEGIGIRLGFKDYTKDKFKKKC